MKGSCDNSIGVVYRYINKPVKLSHTDIHSFFLFFRHVTGLRYSRYPRYSIERLMDYDYSVIEGQ